MNPWLIDPGQTSDRKSDSYNDRHGTDWHSPPGAWPKSAYVGFHDVRNQILFPDDPMPYPWRDTYDGWRERNPLIVPGARAPIAASLLKQIPGALSSLYDMIFGEGGNQNGIHKPMGPR